VTANFFTFFGVEWKKSEKNVCDRGLIWLAQCSCSAVCYAVFVAIHFTNLSMHVSLPGFGPWTALGLLGRSPRWC